MKKETKQNIGEWSEFYVFLRLLADRKLYAADADLNRIRDAHYPIVQVLRRSKNKKDELSYKP